MTHCRVAALPAAHFVHSSTDVQFHWLAPPAHLRPWVACGVEVVFRDPPGSGLLPCRFPALVEGGLTLVLEGRLHAPAAWGGVPLPAALLSAPTTGPMTLLRTPSLRCVGLRLHPAGTQALLGASPTALPAGLVDAADVFGAPLAALGDRLCSGRPAPQVLQVLFDFVDRQLRAPWHLERNRRARQLQTVALRGTGPEQAIGLSRRQFERVFVSTFGLAPKPFQRIARVEALLRQGLRSSVPGAELALAHGYYDQSHMARELRELVGAPLGTLRAAVAAGDPAYWPLAVGTAAAA